MSNFQSIFKGDLPLCDALLFSNIVLHHVLFSDSVRSVSRISLLILSCASISSHIYLYYFYHHCVTTVFNAMVPPLLSRARFYSYFEFYKLVRPLEIGWRFFTARWRVLPDVLVLGEVRCGTTTLCAHLKGMGASLPFCPWKHPELDKKETFYFAAHYLGNVNPSHYALCFPLKPDCFLSYFIRLINKLLWVQSDVEEEKRKLSCFFTFDGCAQYLTSPSAPYLIAQAYAQRGLPPPVLVACLRDPVQQAVSWWKYENAAMQWGQSMGLSEANKNLRGLSYPPNTIREALTLSRSRSTNLAYIAADRLYSSTLPSTNIMKTEDDDNANGVVVNRSCTKKNNVDDDDTTEKLSIEDEVWIDALISTAHKNGKKKHGKFKNVFKKYLDGNDEGLKMSLLKQNMPLWAGVWPGGQLAAIGRNGLFSQNILRFENCFQKHFDQSDYIQSITKKDDSLSSTSSTSQHHYVTIVDLSEQANLNKLKLMLLNLSAKIDCRRKYIHSKNDGSSNSSNFNSFTSIDLTSYFKVLNNEADKSSTSRGGDGKSNKVLIRNSGPIVSDSLNPSEKDIKLLESFFLPEKKKMKHLFETMQHNETKDVELPPWVLET